MDFKSAYLALKFSKGQMPCDLPQGSRRVSCLAAGKKTQHVSPDHNGSKLRF